MGSSPQVGLNKHYVGGPGGKTEKGNPSHPNRRECHANLWKHLVKFDGPHVQGKPSSTDISVKACHRGAAGH